MFKSFLIVGAGGAIGAMLRYGTYKLFGSDSIWVPTLVVNIVGSFVLGALLAYVWQDDSLQSNTKLFLATGICGGLTTFSTFAVENMQMLQEGKYSLAAFYTIISMVLGVGAAFLGYKII